MDASSITSLSSIISTVQHKASNSSPEKEESLFKKLEPLFIKYCHDQKPHIFLHKDEYGTSEVSPGLRDYTDQELLALKIRDFETRLFITNQTCDGDSVWLRTHWTDNHLHDSTLRVFRDFFKAYHATKNFTAAKSSLSEALTMCMEGEDSNYYSFAITVASGLSNMGENISFEVHDGMMKSEDEIDIARRKFCLMMHMIFSKMETSNFLWAGEGSNIYRLAYCSASVPMQNNMQILYPIFSFLLQIMLTVFVLSENITERHYLFDSFGEEGVSTNLPLNMVLAVVTLIYSVFVAAPGIVEVKEAFRFYGGFGFLQSLDFIANAILPFIILVSGFFIIANSESYIESVLNTAALLFISEIDDDLPQLVGLDESFIIKNFLVFQSFREFTNLRVLKDKAITEDYVKKVDDAIGVQFSDFYLTHWKEQGSTSEECIHFKPHEIISASGGEIDHQISATKTLNEYCLIKKITWRYTSNPKFLHAIKPRIGYLKLEMINGDEVEINMRDVFPKLNLESVTHELEGVFIITTFQMSSAILRLRVCGSYDAHDFEKAFDYYALWNITPHARKLLRNYQKVQETSFKYRRSDSLSFDAEDNYFL